MRIQRPAGKPAPRAAMTLVEVITCLVILGIAVAAGAQAMASFAAGSRIWQDRSTAIELAHALMAEINAPSGTNIIGREAGESADDRRTYDDIDDYNGWDATPPKDMTNAPMTAYAGFRQQVEVSFDESVSPAAVAALQTGCCKKIKVTISRDGKVLARLVTIRAKQSGMPVPE
jgi:prepilin-type N-terminal cleavage/methylation domain-containing protein